MISKEFETNFDNIKEEEDGYMPQGPWAELVAACRKAAMANDHELSWQSGGSDCEELLTFVDGSKLMIANPRQSSFAGFIRVLK